MSNIENNYLFMSNEDKSEIRSTELDKYNSNKDEYDNNRFYIIYKLTNRDTNDYIIDMLSMNNWNSINNELTMWNLKSAAYSPARNNFINTLTTDNVYFEIIYVSGVNELTATDKARRIRKAHAIREINSDNNGYRLVNGKYNDKPKHTDDPDYYEVQNKITGELYRGRSTQVLQYLYGVIMSNRYQPFGFTEFVENAGGRDNLKVTIKDHKWWGK